jgi:hypothetical protein
MKAFKRVPSGVVAFAIMLAVAMAGLTNGAKAATATIGPFSTGSGTFPISGFVVNPSFPFPADDAFAFHLNKEAKVSGIFNFVASVQFAVTLNIDLTSGATHLVHTTALDQILLPNPIGGPIVIPAQPGLFSLNLLEGDYLLAFSGNYGAFSGSLTFAEAPIPAALPLLATALGGLGFVGWRRKRG